MLDLRCSKVCSREEAGGHSDWGEKGGQTWHRALQTVFHSDRSEQKRENCEAARLRNKITDRGEGGAREGGAEQRVHSLPTVRATMAQQSG